MGPITKRYLHFWTLGRCGDTAGKAAYDGMDFDVSVCQSLAMFIFPGINRDRLSCDHRML